MTNVSNVGFYPGCHQVVANPAVQSEMTSFKDKINDEIQFKQAYVKVDFLKNTLEKHGKELTPVQKNVLMAELQEAQRELANLQQQLNAKYGVAS